MSIRAGDIVRLFDGTTTPQKQKWFLCVFAGEGWFLRINTKAHWRPCMPLAASADPCLQHDCYLELRGVIEYDQDEVDRALLMPANRVGRLSDATLTNVLKQIREAKTLTADEKATIAREVEATISRK